ncbi:MAG: dipicolinate synthase subunit B [Clostridia bacterium]|nr:dipicolinate synthase subunit B [Clostridia bacterium]
MSVEGKKIGFALCGSFCTFAKVMPEAKALVDAGAHVYPIMSEIAFSTDTRFGKAADFKKYLEDITGNEIISSIKAAEPIGPKGYLDALVVAPCTGNTLAKIANGVTDSAVSMAAKANLRNDRPLIIAVSTNDGLSANAKNIGMLLPKKNVYFVPFGQDDCVNKPDSLVADMTKILPAVETALEGKQIQPVLYAK